MINYGRLIAGGIGVGRMALGCAALVLPEKPLRPWLGATAGTEQAQVLGRALGGRDVALGTGAVLAAVRNDPAFPAWAAAGGFADLADAAATVLAWKSLPPVGRVLVLAAAGGSAALTGAAVVLGRSG